MTCIRHGKTIDAAGFLLEANAERHLKSPDEMCRLFAPWPHAIAATRSVADACAFSLWMICNTNTRMRLCQQGRNADGGAGAADVGGRGVALS